MNKITYLVSTAISKVQFCFFHVERDAGRLCHHFDVQCFAWLHPYHQFVSLCLPVKDITWYILVLYSNFCFPLI